MVGSRMMAMMTMMPVAMQPVMVPGDSGSPLAALEKPTVQRSDIN